jgi:hypothetical protein
MASESSAFREVFGLAPTSRSAQQRGQEKEINAASQGGVRIVS